MNINNLLDYICDYVIMAAPEQEEVIELMTNSDNVEYCCYINFNCQ